MKDFLSLHDADQIVEESAPVPKPGYVPVFLGMLRDPAKTLRDAFAHPIPTYAVTFAAVGGIYWVVNLAIAQTLGTNIAFPMLLASIPPLGIAVGIGYMFAFTILLDWSCDILGGEATRKQIRMALAYAGVPGIIALVLFGIPRILIFGQSLFLPERAWMSANPALVWGLWFGDAVCFVWSLTLILKALKIMNGFGTGKAVAAALLPLAPIVLIGALFIVIVWSGVFFAPPAF